MSHSSTRKVLAISALSLALLGAATGCSAINEQATEKVYSASDGVSTNINGLQLRNIMIISGAEGEPGRLIGSVLNPTPTSASIDFKLNNETITFSIDPEAEVRLENADPAQIFPEIPVIPGATLNLPVTVTSASTSVDQNVVFPILDGTLPEYRPYVPSPLPSDAATRETATPGETPLVTESPTPTTTP